VFGFLRKKFSIKEEEELKAAAHQELGKAHLLAVQAQVARLELEKAITEAQEVIEQRTKKRVTN
jgi:hypothetical protein